MSGGSERVTVGYKYYLGIHMALCHGPIDKITQVQVDGRIAWEGLAEGGPITIDAPELFGGKSREGGVSGTVDIEMGGPDQAPNSYLQSVLGTDMPAFRGVTCAVLNQVYTGNNPYLKPWSFTAQRIHTRMDGQDQWYDSYSEIPRPNSDGTSTAAECLPYDCTAFEDYILTDSGADFYGIFANNKPDATSYLYNYNTVTAQNFSLEGSIGATTQYDTPAARIGVCYDGAFYRQTNNHAYPYVDKAWTKDVYLSAGMVFIDNGNTGSKQIMGIKHGQNSGRFTVDYNFDTGVWTVDFGASSATMSAPIASNTPILVYSAFNEANGLYFLRVIDGGTGDETTKQGILQAGAGSNFGTGFVDLTNYGDVSNFFDNTIILGWIKENDVDVSDSMGRAFLRSIEGYTVPAGCSPCSDMNPAHIIRECLTDPDWGLGYADADIDDTAFQAAADTLFTENMGISLLWSKEMPIEDFIAEILRHIDAVLYVDRTTGKFVLSLIRGDYSESNLLVLDETNVSNIKDARRPTVGELTSSVTINYWDGNTGETGSVIQHNQALIQVQGAVKHTTIQYPGFTNNEVAQRVGIRDLTALSTSLLSCTVTANREASTLNIGDAFILDWPDLAINSQVMRVQQMGLGDGRDNTIKIDAVEDVFATPAYLALGDGDVDTPWVDPTTLVPAPATPRLVTETPYYQLVIQSGETQVNNIIADDPDVGFLLTAGGRQGGELNARLHVDSGAGYSQFAYLDFAPHGYLTTEIGATDTQIYLTDGEDLDDVESGTIAQIGDELIRVDSLTEDSSGTFILVGRGILDTVPVEHGTDSVGQDSNNDNNRSDAVIFWGGSTASDNVQYTASDSIDVKMQTVLGSNVYSLDATPVDSMTMASRAYRPYPPGRLAIDGESYPEANSSSEIYWTGTHEISWAHRDRLQQTDGNLYDYTEGNIGPEAGTTYRIDIYSTLQSGTVTAPWWTVDGIATTSYSMDSNTDTSRGEPAPETDLIHVKVTSLRDGYESWQSPVATLSYVSDSVGDSAGFDSVGSNAGDLYWSNVSLLLSCDGADTSTTFTDTSSNVLTVTAGGNAQVDTAQSQFGGASLLLDGTGDYLALPNDSLLDMAAGAFTIEGWVRPDLSQSGNLIALAERTSNWAAIRIICLTSGLINVVGSTGGDDWNLNFSTATGVLTTNTWHHFALTRDGNDYTLWIDGVSEGTQTLAGTLESAGTLYTIGAIRDGGVSAAIKGHVDEVRITKGVARYTGAFTSPSAPFPTS